MRITRLQVRDVRRHRDLDLPLDRGLTVIRGPNESGKTTIQRALELVLTRRVTSASADLDTLRPWGADDDSRPWIRLEFEQEDEEATRSGSIEKSFRGAKGTVRLDYEGQSITDPAMADQVLAELTGIPTEAFFRSTASVRHHEVDDLARDEAALRDRLQASISGADRGTSRAKRQLGNAIHDLNTQGAKNPGKLKVVETALAAEAVAVADGEAALARLERDRDTLAQARDHRAVAERRLAETRAMLEKARQAERLSAERDAAMARFERYRAAVGLSEEIATLRANHPARDPLPVLRTLVGRLRELDVRIRELRAALAGDAPVDFQLEAPQPRSWRPTALISVVLLVAAVALVAADSFQVIALDAAPVIAGILVVVAIALALVGRRQRIQAVAHSQRRQLLEAEVDRRLRGRSVLEQELRTAENESANQLSGLELPDVPAAEALLAAEEAHVARIDVLAAELSGLVGREPAETLPAIRDGAALEADQKAAALSELGPIAREARARERLEAELGEHERAADSARDEEAGARARVEQNPVDAEEVTVHAERRAGLEERLAALLRRARVYAATLKAIEDAETATMRTATRYLERRMVVDVDRVTGGRYRRVRVDDTDLGIEVFAPERNDWVDVGTLSQGTLDLVYLAARLGLVRLVTEGRRPPLVFDDPFVTLDDERATRALTLLREISRDFQVLYLTTSSRYDEAADAVRILEGPTAADTAAPASDEGAVAAG